MAKKSKGQPVQKKKCPLKTFQVGIKQNDDGLKHITIDAYEVEYDSFSYDSQLVFLGKDKEVVAGVKEWFYWAEITEEDQEQENPPILPENWDKVE